MEDKQTRFYGIAHDFLRTVELVPTREAWEKGLEGIYHHISSGKYFTKRDDLEDNSAMALISPFPAWFDFVTQTQTLFDKKVSFRRLNFKLDEVFGSLNEFPLTENQVSQYIDEIFAWVERQYHSAYTALVPVYNLHLGDGIEEIKLANSVLRRGSDASLLATFSKHERIKSYVEFKPELHFLAVPVSGDSEAITYTARLEANYSLALLRFMSNWSRRIADLNYTTENDAIFVTLYPTENAQFLFYDPEIGTEEVGMLSFKQRSLFYVSKSTFEHNKKLYELDTLNYHFQKEVNPVSALIIRALEFYDSGVRAETPWQALYRYVVSINSLVPESRSKDKKILPQLQTLIEFGGNYVGQIDDDENLQSFTWSELVGRIASPFHDSYVLRGQLLHGDVLHPTWDEVSKVRILANNCVRLTSKLARELNWLTKADIKRWFKEPSYLPSLNQAQDNDPN